MGSNYFYDEFSQQILVRRDLVDIDYSQIEPRISVNDLRYTENASAGPWVIERPSPHTLSFQGSIISARFIEQEIRLANLKRAGQNLFDFNKFKPKAWTMEFTLWN